MRADYHVHTSFSDDSFYEMEDVVRDAIKKNIDELAFTDHVDYGVKNDWDAPVTMRYRKGGPGEPEQMPLANVDYPRYAATFQALKEKYADRISLKFGLEFGMQQSTISQYESLFSRFPFDFIILSVHEINNKEFWNQDFQKGLSQQEYTESYYRELLSLVSSYHHYSVLGHLDLISRYDTAGPYPFSKIEPYVADILRTVISDGKGIEINTSSHRYGLSDLTPARDILCLYRDLGGTILTIGSDSHKKEHLGAYIDWTKQTLLQLGFDSFCTYSHMEPVFHSLK